MAMMMKSNNPSFSRIGKRPMRRRLTWIALVVVSPMMVTAQECSSDGICDKYEQCAKWKDSGECQRNKPYMEEMCPFSCSNQTGSGNEEAKISSHNNDVEGECKDLHERCPRWQLLGECEANPTDMHKWCAESCGRCDLENQETGLLNNHEEMKDETCADRHSKCRIWGMTECVKNPRYMLVQCPKVCKSCDYEFTTEDEFTGVVYPKYLLDVSLQFGVRQKATDGHTDKVLDRIESTIQYLGSDQVKQLPTKARRACKNKHEMCTLWQTTSECESNRPYMMANCAAACHTCHNVEELKRCPPKENQIPSLVPGDINQIFYNIASGRSTDDEEGDEASIYTVQVHSRPSDIKGRPSIVQDKSMAPWVLTIDNFLSDEEADTLIRLGEESVFKLYEESGATRHLFEATSCADASGCREKSVPKRVLERAAKMVGLPPENCEDLQLIKHNEGHYHGLHFDYDQVHRKQQCGPRVLTYILFLSNAEEGGEVDFPLLSDAAVRVPPVKGRAILFPAVLDSAPFTKDDRLAHQTLRVTSGTMFVAIARFHIHDFAGPQKRGCV